MIHLLDIRTLSLSSAIISAVLFGYMVHLQSTRRTYPGFKLWTLAALCSGLGLILLGLRGLVPDLVSVVFANFSIILAMSLIYRGLGTFGELRLKLWPDVLVMTCYMMAIIWFTYGQPSVNWRIIVFSLLNCYYALLAAHLAAWAGATLLRGRNWLLIVTLAGYGLFFLLRAVLTFLWEQQISDLMSAGTLQAMTFLISFAGHILVFTGLVFLNTQRLELDLTKAQEELKVLGGLLPICAHCKRIRDDGGYWHQVEQYITAHSQAEFTHGICPQCLRKLYPEVAGQVLERAHTAAEPVQGP